MNGHGQNDRPLKDVKRMVLYNKKRHSRGWIALAAVLTFLLTLALLWTDAGGIS